MKTKCQFALVVVGILLVALAIAAAARLKEARRTREAPILMYHKIGEVTDNAWWVPSDVFERQLRRLRFSGYTTVLPEDLINHHRTGKRLPDKPVMITFDDGYRDSLALAEALLKKYGFRAVVFLPTDFIAETAATRKDFEGVACLTWPEVQAMQERQTFVFGGHSHRHENLLVAGDAEADIRECFRELRRHGIRPPYSFCYPHGQYNEQTIATVKRAGFQIAFIGEDQVARTGRDMNLLAVPRVSVMGGRHDFKFSGIRSSIVMSDPAMTTRTVALHVRHEGIPIEVSPHLVMNGLAADQGLPAEGGASGDQGWLPAVEVSNADYEWHWPRLPETSNLPSLRLEIWDKHRLFLMFTEKICGKNPVKHPALDT